ncbi:MAG: hypothetical protein ACKOPO_14360 [Novosphingobium sp.]
MAQFLPEVLLTLAVSLAIGLGFLKRGKVRAFLITSLWLMPLWFAIWWIQTDQQGEFDSVSILFLITPLFLAASAAITIFPFKLTDRLLEIRRGDDFNRS